MTEAFLRPVSYNPYKAPTFMMDGQPVHQCKYAKFGNNRQVLGSLPAENGVQ